MLMHTRGHPRDDARERDGADRQAGARLLRRRVGRGQLRHRRLRAHHGPQRPGAVLGARPRRRLRASCSPTTSTPTSRRASASRAAPRRPTRSTATSAPRRTTAPGSDLRRVGDIFSDATNPGRKKPFDIRSVMRAVIDADHRAARALGRRCATPRSPSSGTPTSAAGRSRCSGIESRPLPRHGVVPADGPEQWTSGTLFPLRVEEDRPRDQRRQRAPAAGRARQPRRASTARPSRCAGCSSSTAPRSAARSSTSTARSSFCVISRYHGGAFVVFSQRLNDEPRDDRARGRARLGDRRRAGRRGRVRARRRRRARAPTQRIARARRAHRGAPRAPSAQRLRAERADALDRGAVGEAAASWRREFDAVHSVERAVEVGSVEPIVIAAPRCAPT